MQKAELPAANQAEVSSSRGCCIMLDSSTAGSGPGKLVKKGQGNPPFTDRQPINQNKTRKRRTRDEKSA